MPTELQIKEEPMDENEIQQQEMFYYPRRQEQQALLKQQLQMELVLKDNLEMDNDLCEDNFHIVEEQEDVITVSAADMRTQDELQFIEQLHAPTQKLSSTPAGNCRKCLKTFKNARKLQDHIKRNNCLAKEKCCICPLTFIDMLSLLNHLKLHRDNYFFCSQLCGASFKTLSLCESHEMKEHKKHNPPRIRYKHFCSFCREGFKTELQLHVHWLQQREGCGKVMQDVALHSNNAANNINNNSLLSSNNNNNSKSNMAIKVSSSNNATSSPTPSACTTTFPITKLRLKSNYPPPLKDNKRRSMEAKDDDMKRMKFVDNIKAKMTAEQMLLNCNTQVEIKEEPLDDDDSLNVTPPTLIPEVILKTEDEVERGEVKEEPIENLASECDNVAMKSLLIHNNKIMNPDFSGKIIPLTSVTMNKVPPLQLISNNNNNINLNTTNNINGNNSLKNITNLKLIRFLPAGIATSNRLGPNVQITPYVLSNGAKIMPGPGSGPNMSFQVLKLIPNTQLLTFKNDQPNMMTTTNCKEEGKKSVLLKLQSMLPIAPKATTVDNQVNKSPPPLLKTATVDVAGAPVTQQVNSLIDQNSEDFKKLQAEAFRKAEELRKKYISKKSLIAIDNLPEKQQLISSLQQQIAQVETPGDSSLVNGTAKHLTRTKAPSPNSLFKCSTEGFALNAQKKKEEPPSLYLPIMSTIDLELVEARYQYPDYIYSWICPYCLKDYSIKRCLKSHLSKAHCLTNRDMEKINVQVKPHQNTELTIEALDMPIKQETAEIFPDSPLSESELTTLSTQTSTTSDQQASTTTTPVVPIKMSALKPKKPRYVCDKCGRKCSSKTMLNDHLLANCSREPQYPCTECPKKFYSAGTLQCHMTIHTGELPHKCNYCEKRFRTRGQVTVHHRTHTGERPFVCQVCSQRFTHRETLIAHLSRHIGMKRYKCYCCEKHFSCISALKTHREIRPDTCGKVKFNPRAIGPRVRVVRGNVIFEPQPEINPYLKSEDPKNVLAEVQNQPEEVN